MSLTLATTVCVVVFALLLSFSSYDDRTFVSAQWWTPTPPPGNHSNPNSNIGVRSFAQCSSCLGNRTWGNLVAYCPRDGKCIENCESNCAVDCIMRVENCTCYWTPHYYSGSFLEPVEPQLHVVMTATGLNAIAAIAATLFTWRQRPEIPALTRDPAFLLMQLRNVGIYVAIFHTFNNQMNTCWYVSFFRIAPLLTLSFLQLFFFAPLARQVASCAGAGSGRLQCVALCIVVNLVALIPFIFYGFVGTIGAAPAPDQVWSILMVLLSIGFLDVVLTSYVFTRQVFAIRRDFAIFGNNQQHVNPSSLSMAEAETALPINQVNNYGATASHRQRRTEIMMVGGTGPGNCNCKRVCKTYFCTLVLTGAAIGGIFAIRSDSSVGALLGGVALFLFYVLSFYYFFSTMGISEFELEDTLEGYRCKGASVTTHGEAYHIVVHTRTIYETDQYGNRTSRTETWEEKVVTHTMQLSPNYKVEDHTATELDPDIRDHPVVDVELEVVYSESQSVRVQIAANEAQCQRECQRRDTNVRVWTVRDLPTITEPNLILSSTMSSLPWTHTPLALVGAVGCFLYPFLVLFQACAVNARAEIKIRKHYE